MLTMQTDRHVANIHFIYNKDDRSYRVAPIIDNEYAFGGQVLSKIMDHELADYDLIKFVSTTKFMTLKTFYYCSTDDYLKNIQQSVEFAIKNPDKDYLNILKTFIEKINTVQAFKKVEELGYEIDRSYKIFVNKCVKFAKNCIMKEMQNYETKDANDELLY